MLADILRTAGRRFRPLTRCSDEIKALCAQFRSHGDLAADPAVLAMRPRSLLATVIRERD